MNEDTGITKSIEAQDRESVIAFQANDQSSFDGLVLRHKDKVFNVCFRLMGDYQEADDCAQETFVKVFRSLKNFRFEASFSTWIHKIAVNTCKNKLASAALRHRGKTVKIDPPNADGQHDASLHIADPAPSPHTCLENKERERLLQIAIDALPHAAKTLVVLRDIEGFSYEEIANITEYNPGTVKSKLARARKQLRDSLKGVI